jgi:hypothetical protein
LFKFAVRVAVKTGTMSRSLVLAITLFAAVTHAAWVNQCASASCPSMMLAVGCSNASSCVLAGGTGSSLEKIYYSVNGFETFQTAQMVRAAVVFRVCLR